MCPPPAQRKTKRNWIYIWVFLYPMRVLKEHGWTWRFSTEKHWVTLDPEALLIHYKLLYSWWRSRLWPLHQGTLCRGRLIFTQGAIRPWFSLNCCRRTPTVKEDWWSLSNSSRQTNMLFEVLFWYLAVCCRLLMLTAKLISNSKSQMSKHIEDSNRIIL